MVLNTNQPFGQRLLLLPFILAAVVDWAIVHCDSHMPYGTLLYPSKYFMRTGDVSALMSHARGATILIRDSFLLSQNSLDLL